MFLFLYSLFYCPIILFHPLHSSLVVLITSLLSLFHHACFERTQTIKLRELFSFYPLFIIIIFTPITLASPSFLTHFNHPSLFTTLLQPIPNYSTIHLTCSSVITHFSSPSYTLRAHLDTLSLPSLSLFPHQILYKYKEPCTSSAARSLAWSLLSYFNFSAPYNRASFLTTVAPFSQECLSFVSYTASSLGASVIQSTRYTL